MLRYLGIALIFFSIINLFFVAYRNSRIDEKTRTFSSHTLLTSSWDYYKRRFILNDGRVIDPSQNDITTSEGQSYALLRAVWIDDKDTFDKVLGWTMTNLKRPEDNLFGWRWGKRTDGTYGFTENGGNNAASDADQDIALALILASRRWSQPEYFAKAQPIMKDLWDKETEVANNKRYLIAGTWANQPDTLVVNPSYFAPYAWRIFAIEDKERDWNSLVSPAYELLNSSSNAPLDKEFTVGLPPNWVAIRKTDGTLEALKGSNLNTNYSWDAIRVPWRVALDYQWNKDKLAKQYLENHFTSLRDALKRDDKLAADYTHDGQVAAPYESPSLYATLLGYYIVTDKKAADRLYQDKILRLYSTSENTFNKDLPYYEQNWLWFGAALYQNYLQPFTQK